MIEIRSTAFSFYLMSGTSATLSLAYQSVFVLAAMKQDNPFSLVFDYNTYIKECLEKERIRKIEEHIQYMRKEYGSYAEDISISVH